MGFTVDEILSMACETCIQSQTRVQTNINDLRRMTVIELLGGTITDSDKMLNIPDELNDLKQGSSVKLHLPTWFVLCSSDELLKMYEMNEIETKILCAQMGIFLLMQIGERSLVGSTFNKLSVKAWCAGVSSISIFPAREGGKGIELFEEAKQMLQYKFAFILEDDTTINQLLLFLKQKLYNCAFFSNAVSATKIFSLLFSEQFIRLAVMKYSLPPEQIRKLLANENNCKSE